MWLERPGGEQHRHIDINSLARKAAFLKTCQHKPHLQLPADEVAQAVTELECPPRLKAAPLFLFTQVLRVGIGNLTLDTQRVIFP